MGWVGWWGGDDSVHEMRGDRSLGGVGMIALMRGDATALWGGVGWGR